MKERQREHDSVRKCKRERERAQYSKRALDREQEGGDKIPFAEGHVLVLIPK